MLGVAWSFAQPRGTHIYSSRVSGQTIHPDCFSFSLLHRHRFSSPFCRESDLRLYGSIHGCVDFLLVARVMFVSFFELFSLDFRARLVPSILRCLGSDLLVGIMDRCLVHLCA